MKYIINANFFVILLFYTSSSFSQVNFKGRVINTNGIIIPKALVQVFDKDTINVLTYTFTDNDGTFSLKIGKQEKVVFNVSAYSYENHFQVVEHFDDNLILNFELTKKAIDLTEVIIISPQRAAKVSKDSISYNLKAIRDSTENSLGDLIKKLPGLEISADGKVKFQGITIDKVLIDGSEFFGNKHQMALENIGANMIEGIDLLLKHSDNINLREFGENSKIALNVKLNSESKNIILGNLETSGGVLNKYLTHSNFFKFLKNGNISLISDFNNIGDMPLSVPDYFDIIGGIESIVNHGNSLTDVSEMIPEYIYNENKVKESKSIFSAFNLALKTAKFKVNSNVFFNTFKQVEERLNNRVFFDNSIPSLNERYSNKNQLLLFNTNLRIQYAISQKSNLKFLFNMTPSNGSSKEEVTNNFYYNTSYNKNNLTVNNQVSYQFKISNNLLYTSELAYKIDKISDTLNLSSSDTNLFNLNSNFILQDYKYTNDRFTSINSLLYKKNKNKYKYSIEYDYSSENLHTNIHLTSFKNEINRDIKNIANKLDVLHYISDKIFLKYQFVSNSYFFDGTLKSLVNNNVSTNFNINSDNNFLVSFQNSNSIVELGKQLTNNYVLNYQSLNTPENIQNNPFVNKKVVIFSYNNYKKKIEQFLTLNLMYSFADSENTTNTTYNNNYSLISNQFGGRYKNFSGIIIYDRKVTNLPLIVKSSLSLDYSSRINYVNLIENNSNARKSILDVNLISSLKQIKTQFQFSYRADYINLKQSLVPENYNLLTQNIGFEAISKIKLFKIAPSVKYLIQDGSLNSNYQTLYGLTINYSGANNKLVYSLKGNNMLNFKKFEQIAQTSNNFIIENTIHSMIPGYILLGMKYNL